MKTVELKRDSWHFKLAMDYYYSTKHMSLCGYMWAVCYSLINKLLLAACIGIGTVGALVVVPFMYYSYEVAPETMLVPADTLFTLLVFVAGMFVWLTAMVTVAAGVVAAVVFITATAMQYLWNYTCIGPKIEKLRKITCVPVAIK